MRKLSYIFLFLSFLLGKLAAQNFEITAYPIESNYYYDVINSFQAPDGRIWISKSHGINYIYDGSNWELFNYNESRDLDSLHSTFLGSDGEIYGISLKGNVAFKYQSGKFIKHKLIDKNYKSENYFSIYYVVTAIIQNKQKFVFASPYEISIYSDNYEYYDLRKYTKDIRLFDVKIINGDVFFTSNKGFYCIKNQNIEKINLTNKKTDKIFSFEYDDTCDKILCLGKNWIGYLEENQIKEITNYKKILPSVKNRLSSYFIKNFENDIFWGNNISIYHYHKKTKTVRVLDQKGGLIANGAFSLFKDRENLFWIATTRGVSKLVRTDFKVLTNKESLYESEVTSILENHNELIIGHNEGFTLLKNGKSVNIPLPKNNFHTTTTRVFDIKKDNKGRIFAACSRLGLVQIVDEKAVKVNLNNSSNIVNGIFIDGKNNFWLSTNDGLRIYNEHLELIKSIQTEKISARIRNIYDFNDKYLFVAGISNPFLINKKNYKIQKIFNFHISVFNFIKVDDKYLLSTRKGLVSWDGKSDKVIQIEKEKLDYSVYFVKQDQNKNLWIGTSKGVFIKTPNQLISFSTKDGLPSNEINRNGFCQDQDGAVWIGTADGLVKFSAIPDRKTEIKPIVDIINITDLNNNIIQKGSSVQLKYTQNDFIVNFRGLSYINELLNSYEVVVTDLEEKSDVRFLQLSNSYKFINQQPGAYKFSVRVKNANGTWSDYKSIYLNIDFPYYQKTWFIFLIFIVFASVILLIQKYYSNKKYAKKLENEVQERTELLSVSNKKYELISETVDEVILSFDKNFKLNYLSPTVESILGISQNIVYRFDRRFSLYEVLNTQFLFFDNKNPQKFISRKEIKIELKTGVVKVLELSTKPIYAVSRFEGLLCVIRDITDIKKIEKEKSIAIVSSVEKERIRIARDLHDHIGQIIVSMKLRIELLKMQYEVNDHLEKVYSQIGIVGSEIRKIINDLNDLPEKEGEFYIYIKDYCENIFKNSGLNLIFESDFIPVDKSKTEKLMIFRVLQEAINNTLKHSKAKNVYIKMNSVDDKLKLIIQDDGGGFNIKTVEKKGKFGLINMTQRIELLEGVMNIYSDENIGTTVELIV